MDISDTVAAKSDQINADDLIGGSIIVTIECVTVAEGEQPVSVYLAGRDGKPWKPCKTMRRLLLHCWGKDHTTWGGRRLELYRDPTVTWGGKEVGGIRVRSMTHIDQGLTIMLTAKEGGKKAAHRVEVLRETPAEPAGPMDLARFRQHLGAALKDGWSKEDIADLMGTAKAEDVKPSDYAGIVRALKDRP